MCMTVSLYGGINLHSCIKNISNSQILEISKNILSGFNLLKKVKIIHFDAHYNNIVIDKDGCPKIIDFGCSFEEDKLHEAVDEYTTGGFYPFWMSVYKYPYRNELLYKYYEDELKFYTKNFVKKSNNDVIDVLFFKDDFNKNRYYKQIVMKNIYKIDIYTFFSSLNLIIEQKNPKLTNLYKVIIGAMDVDVDKSFTVQQCIDILNS
jgi:serine/threonine protein kinase